MKTKKTSVVVTRSCCSFGPGMSRMLSFHRKMSIARSIGGWVDPRTGFNVYPFWEPNRQAQKAASVPTELFRLPGNMSTGRYCRPRASSLSCSRSIMRELPT